MVMILRGLNDLLACSLSQMLLNLHKKTWMDGLTLQDYEDHCALNQKTVKVTISFLRRSDLGQGVGWDGRILALDRVPRLLVILLLGAGAFSGTTPTIGFPAGEIRFGRGG